MVRPYGSHYLTEEKKKLAEENMPLVWWFLNKEVLARGTIQTHEIDDCSGYLIWHYCMAAEGFEEGKGSKFGSYAILAMRHGLCRYLSLRKRFRERYILTDFTIKGEDGERVVEPPYISKTEHVTGWNDVSFLFDLIELTPMEEQIIYFYYEQKTTYEKIGDLLGYTRERIRQKHGDIILRLKKAVKEHNITLEDFCEV